MSDPNRDRYLPFLPAPAPGPRPLAEILDDLSRPMHPSILQEKKKGGATLTFASWHTYVRILNKYAPGWSHTLVSHLSADGTHVVIDTTITIPTSDYGLVSRSGTGSDEEEERGYGDASDRADSQSFRRTAAKFGLGLSLYYEKDGDRTPPPPLLPRHLAPAPAAPVPVPALAAVSLAAQAALTEAEDRGEVAPPPTQDAAFAALGKDAPVPSLEVARAHFKDARVAVRKSSEQALQFLRGVLNQPTLAGDKATAAELMQGADALRTLAVQLGQIAELANAGGLSTEIVVAAYYEKLGQPGRVSTLTLADANIILSKLRVQHRQVVGAPA